MKDMNNLELQMKLVEKFIPLEKLTKEIKEDMLDFIVFRSELTKESNRGCALLAASHLDYLLEKMLKSKLIGTPKQLKAMFDFNGPLGTFSSRIQLSYAIGLISKFHLNDLQIIRKIRNEFGHTPSILAFENQKINSLCNELKLTVNANKTAKSKFITSVSFISGTLFGLALKENKFEEKAEVDIEKIKGNNDVFREMLKDELGINENE